MANCCAICGNPFGINERLLDADGLETDNDSDVVTRKYYVAHWCYGGENPLFVGPDCDSIEEAKATAPEGVEIHTISQSGSVGTGLITVSNEVAATMTAVASAVAGCTTEGAYSFRLDRNIRFVNSTFSAFRETILTSIDAINGNSGGNVGNGVHVWDVDINSSVDLRECSFSLDFVDNGEAPGVFFPAFGSTTSNDTGDVRMEKCLVKLGLPDTACSFLRCWNTSKSYTFKNNTYIGSEPGRGAGLVFGDGTSVVENNTSIGCGVMNTPAAVNRNNRAFDAGIYIQLNTFQTLTPGDIEEPNGDNFSTASFQLLLRQNGTATFIVRNSLIPQTVQNFGPQGTGVRFANIDFPFTLDGTYKRALTGLPVEGARLDVVPTTTGGPSSAITKSTDVAGEVTQSDIFVRRLYYGDLAEPPLADTAYGPHRRRWWVYGLQTIDDPAVAYVDAINEVINGREEVSLTLGFGLGATVAAYPSLQTLDKLRDRHFYETGSDIDLLDLSAGNGIVSVPSSYTVTLDGSASAAFDRSGSVLTYKGSEFVSENPAAVFGSVVVSGGAVISVAVTDGGDSYLVGDAVALSGDGSGATAEVGSVDANGAILTVLVTAGGSGYTAATASIDAKSVNYATLLMSTALTISNATLFDYNLILESGGTVSYPSGLSVGGLLSVRDGSTATFSSDTQAAAGTIGHTGGTVILTSCSGAILQGASSAPKGAFTTSSNDEINLTAYGSDLSGLTVTMGGSGTVVISADQTPPTLIGCQLQNGIPYTWSTLADDTKYRIYDAEAEDFSDWTATAAYTLTSSVTPTVANTFHYECVSAGNSGATEPTWPTTVGERVTDGTVVWECVAGLTGRVYEIGVTAGGNGIDTTIPAGALNHSISCNTRKDGGPGNAKLWLSVSRPAAAAGIAIDEEQVDDTVYNKNNITGSLVTEFTWNDIVAYRWEVTPTQNDQEYLFGRLYAYNVYWETTDEGIRRGQQLRPDTETQYTFLNGRRVFNTDFASWTKPTITGAVSKNEAGSTIDPTVPCESGVTRGMGAFFANSGYSESTNQAIQDIKNNTDEIDVAKIDGDATSAVNLKDMYNGIGYTADDTAPASRSQVDNLGGSSGSSINFTPVEDNTAGPVDPSGTTFVGSVVSGTFEDLDNNLNTFHSINDVGNVIDIVYGYQVGGGKIATSYFVNADVDGGPDQMSIEVWDHAGAAWETIGEIDDNDQFNIPLLQKHTGTGAELGKVYIRFSTPAGETPSNLTIFAGLASAVNPGTSVGYADGAIWVDGTASNPNSEPFVDGVADNPVSTWSAALALSSSVGLKRFKVLSGTAVQFTENSDGIAIEAQNAVLDLNGQSIDRIAIVGIINLSGIGTNDFPGGYTIRDCQIFELELNAFGIIDRCAFAEANTLTLNSTPGIFDDQINIIDCVSAVAGTDVPSVDASAATKTMSISFRRWSGGLALTVNPFVTASVDVVSGGNIKVYGTGGTVAIRGTCTVQDFSGGAVTIVEDAVINRFTIADASKNIVHQGTAQGAGNGINQIQLAADASAVDGTYDPGLLVINAGTGAGQARMILDYDGTAKTATVDRSWKVAPDPTSEYTIESAANLASVNEGMLQAGGANTATLNALASADDDAYVGQTLWLRGGPGEDEACVIVAYDGTTKVATMASAWKTAPTADTCYMVLPGGHSLLAPTVHTGATVPTVTEVTNPVQTTKDAEIDSIKATIDANLDDQVSEAVTAATAAAAVATTAATEATQGRKVAEADLVYDKTGETLQYRERGTATVLFTKDVAGTSQTEDASIVEP